MQQVLHKEQVFLRDSAREGRGWGVQGAPGLGKGIREEFVIWVSSVSLSPYISKLRRGLWGQTRGKMQKEREEWNKPGGHVGPGGRRPGSGAAAVASVAWPYGAPCPVCLILCSPREKTKITPPHCHQIGPCDLLWPAKVKESSICWF